MASHHDLCKTTENVSISLPSFLIELIDLQCAKTDLSRSALVARAVRKYLLTHADNPATWQAIYQQATRE